MQIAKSFDPVTLQKIKKSGLLALSGFAVAAIGILLADPTVTAYIQAHPLLSAAVGSFVPFIVNGINEWRKGQE